MSDLKRFERLRTPSRSDISSLSESPATRNFRLTGGTCDQMPPILFWNWTTPSGWPQDIGYW